MMATMVRTLLHVLPLVLLFSSSSALAVNPHSKSQAVGTNKNNSHFTTKKPDAWELSGVMAARNRHKSWTAQINWYQTGTSSYQIRLFGPLGSGTVMIARKGSLVHFRDGPKTFTAKNADELLQRQTGVRLPVNNLYYWVRGIPAPGSINMEKRGTANQLILLKQAGFTIEYPEYLASQQTLLPKVIKLQGNGVFVKLVIKRWKV